MIWLDITLTFKEFHIFYCICRNTRDAHAPHTVCVHTEARVLLNQKIMVLKVVQFRERGKGEK